MVWEHLNYQVHIFWDDSNMYIRTRYGGLNGEDNAVSGWPRVTGGGLGI